MNEQIRTCVDCGHEYVYDYKNKRGSTTSRCKRCQRRHSDHNTKLLMLEAAGGSCRNCGYNRSLSAITFYDPYERLVPEKKPKNREEKINWASSKIALCNRCSCEISDGLLFLKVHDLSCSPPTVGFYTEQAEIIVPTKENKKAIVSPITKTDDGFIDVEVVQ